KRGRKRTNGEADEIGRKKSKKEEKGTMKMTDAQPGKKSERKKEKKREEHTKLALTRICCK
ncbi:hypothetical protein EBT25_04225, partial [bacterium]|nr:hypothetical protein [bacterium]